MDKRSLRLELGLRSEPKKRRVGPAGLGRKAELDEPKQNEEREREKGESEG
jgi:hypothetical protein